MGETVVGGGCLGYRQVDVLRLKPSLSVFQLDCNFELWYERLACVEV
jgi:hypothetical protein